MYIHRGKPFRIPRFFLLPQHTTFDEFNFCDEGISFLVEMERTSVTISRGISMASRVHRGCGRVLEESSGNEKKRKMAQPVVSRCLIGAARLSLAVLLVSRPFDAFLQDSRPTSTCFSRTHSSIRCAFQFSRFSRIPSTTGNFSGLRNSIDSFLPLVVELQLENSIKLIISEK